MDMIFLMRPKYPLLVGPVLALVGKKFTPITSDPIFPLLHPHGPRRVKDLVAFGPFLIEVYRHSR